MKELLMWVLEGKKVKDVVNWIIDLLKEINEKYGEKELKEFFEHDRDSK